MSFNNTGIVFLQEGDIVNKKIMTGGKVFVMVQGSFCFYCTQSKPDFIEASKQWKNKVLFATIQTDGDPSEKALAKELKAIDPSISGIPAYLLFNNGKYVATYTGNRDPASISKFLSSN
jgi:thiol-disulfide isomerase/thioredoxin